MRHLLAGCFGILCIAGCNDATSPSATQSSTPRAPVNAPFADVVPGHYIVVMKPGAASSEAVVHRHALSKLVSMDQKFGTVMHGFSAAVSEEDVDSLRNDPDVESIEPDRYVHQLGSQTGMGWALDRVDQHAMPLNGAFAYGATGAGVNIYVVDGGVRYTHSEFGGRAHFAFDALGGNGSDCNGHGTGVAGVAAGSVHGVAKGANIYSVRVFPCSGTTTLSTILAGVDWVTAHHKPPAVANLSLGAAAAPILDTAVERSIRSGVTYVIAGGNNGGDACAMSPGKLKDVINVGATDASDSRASWSNYGSCINMFAPGVAVVVGRLLLGCRSGQLERHLGRRSDGCRCGRPLSAGSPNGVAGDGARCHPRQYDERHGEEPCRLGEQAALHLVDRLGQRAGRASAAIGSAGCSGDSGRDRCRRLVQVRVERLRFRCKRVAPRSRCFLDCLELRRRKVGHWKQVGAHVPVVGDLQLERDDHGQLRKEVLDGQTDLAGERFGFGEHHDSDLVSAAWRAGPLADRSSRRSRRLLQVRFEGLRVRRERLTADQGRDGVLLVIR